MAATDATPYRGHCMAHSGVIATQAEQSRDIIRHEARMDHIDIRVGIVERMIAKGLMIVILGAFIAALGANILGGMITSKLASGGGGSGSPATPAPSPNTDSGAQIVTQMEATEWKLESPGTEASECGEPSQSDSTPWVLPLSAWYLASSLKAAPQ